MLRMIRILSAILLIASTNLAAADSPAPSFELPTQQGSVKLEDLKGKVIYLDFWASWCKPCLKSFPWMNEIQQRYREQGLEVVAINLDAEREMADEFLGKVAADFTVAFDAAGDIASAYQLRGMPSSYLIDREGRLRASHTGFRDKDRAKMEAAIRKLLEQGS